MIDLMTFIGLGLGMGAIYLVMYWGDATHLLYHRDAAVLVFGGTLGSIMIATPWTIFRNTPKALIKVFFTPGGFTPEKVIALLVEYAERSKREGIDKLSAEIGKLKDKFLADGFTMVIDGLSPELVRENLEKEITFIRKRHYQISNVFRTMGTFSPIFGLLATLLGVVQVLKCISDPQSLGASMAIAVTGTFYGICGANFIFLPIAGKLDAHTEAEVLLKEVMIEGILSVQQGDIPLIVSRKLQAFLAYRIREKKQSGK